MSDKTYEIAGVKFKASEVTNITIKRDGKTIEITKKEDDPKIVGFAK